MVRLCWPSLHSVINVAETLKLPIDSIARTQGWLRSVKLHKKVVFGKLNDGLSSDSIQVVFDADEQTKLLRSQCFVDVTGRIVTSPGRAQSVELQCTQLHQWRGIDNSDEAFSPLLTALSSQYDRHDTEVRATAWQHWRQYAPFRTRWPPFAALLRARAGLVRLLQRHLDERLGFVHVHTPVLTRCDSEGAGQVFSVSTESESGNDEDELYFSSPAHLTVSGQLHLEAIASGISRVYCLGPAFRAELSRTRRHLSEFFMLEAELVAVSSCQQLCDHVEELLRSVVLQFVQQHRADLQVIHPDGQLASLEERLISMFSGQFVRVTYSEAVERLTAASEAGQCERLQLGDDLQREHELALVTLCGNVPVFVTTWPAHLKPFYMKRCDTDWVECMDLLIPDIGELVGGSVREDCADQLRARMAAESNNNNSQLHKQLEWYWQLRRFGCPSSAGYGLGVERLLMLVTDISSVRDTLPFPRWYQHCPA